MVIVNAAALSLRPKSAPKDMEKIQELYRFLDEHLSGLEDKMKSLDCEKLEITVDITNNTTTGGTLV